jgi:hypothetical protein
MTNDNFKQFNIENTEKTLNDYIQIKDGRLVIQAPFETNNFLAGKRGVRIAQDGLNSSGGTINGATIGGSTGLSVSNGGTGVTTLTANDVLIGNGTNPITSITGWTGTFYVATSSGGAVTHAVTVNKGIITNVA